MGLVFASGDKWRDNRRFSVHTMKDVGFGKAVLEPFVREQGRKLVEELGAGLGPEGAGEVDIYDPFCLAIINIINRILFGKVPERDRQLHLRSMLDDIATAFYSPVTFLLNVQLSSNVLGAGMEFGGNWRPIPGSASSPCWTTSTPTSSGASPRTGSPSRRRRWRRRSPTSTRTPRPPATSRPLPRRCGRGRRRVLRLSRLGGKGAEAAGWDEQGAVHFRPQADPV